MRKPLKIVIALVVIAAIIGVLWTYHVNNLYEQSFSSQYRYQVDIDLEGGSSVNNLTLYAPLPTNKEKNDAVGTMENSTGPEDWELSIIDTEYGKMLKISLERLESARLSTPLPHEPGEGAKTPSAQNRTVQLNRVTKTVDLKEEINTANPKGSEPLLWPKYNLTSTECPFPHPDNGLKCYEYQSAVYIDYESGLESEPDARMVITTTFEGTNTWWIYGWTGNEYRDRVYLVSEGEKGWLTANGELIIGQGNYR